MVASGMTSRLSESNLTSLIARMERSRTQMYRPPPPSPSPTPQGSCRRAGPAIFNRCACWNCRCAAAINAHGQTEMDAVAVQYKLAYIQKSDADLLIRNSTRKFNAEKPSNGLRQVWKSMRKQEKIFDTVILKLLQWWPLWKPIWCDSTTYQYRYYQRMLQYLCRHIFEMWFWHRTKQISWIERTDDSILQELGIKSELIEFNIIHKRKLSYYFGHLCWDGCQQP